MANWVQNVIVISPESLISAKSNRRLKLLVKNIQDMCWMADQGFREQIDDNGYFGVSREKDDSIWVYADTKWKPPTEVFEIWASKGLIFEAYYYDIENRSFVGKWCSTGLAVHFEMEPRSIANYIRNLQKLLPADIDRVFDVIYNLTKDRSDLQDLVDRI